MARKSAFSPEDVVQAGFRLVDKLGREQLTARNVAEELGSSTAPVYSNFSNMEELEQALVEEAMSRILAASKTGNSGDHFLDIGLGILDFAWQHPRWYEALFLVKNAQDNPGFTLMEELLEAMDSMDEFQDMGVPERTIVLKKMAIFTHGLATEICISGTEEISWEEWKILLEEVGDTIVRDALQRTPRSTKEIEMLGSLCNWSQIQNLEKEED
jgi:AcrR family transcriptional regulator